MEKSVEKSHSDENETVNSLSEIFVVTSKSLVCVISKELFVIART